MIILICGSRRRMEGANHPWRPECLTIFIAHLNMKTPPVSAEMLQARFMEIGLPEPLMVNLQVTDYDLGWDAEALANRERFLKQGYILIVDRRAGKPVTYLVAPNRLRDTAVTTLQNRIDLVSRVS
jgi:hypothetical protein